MKNASLEYCKFILEKVSFDEILFEKELKKALRKLAATEVKELIEWIQMRFSNQTIINTLNRV